MEKAMDWHKYHDNHPEYHKFKVLSTVSGKTKTTVE